MAKGKYEYWLTDEGLILLEAWARDGLTDEQIAHNMGITRETLRVWKNKFSAISVALKKGKEVVDIEVENALHKRAIGFSRTLRKPFKVKNTYYENGKRIEREEIVYADEEVYYPPETAADIFWLKNRKPEKWRDRPNMSEESSGKLEELIQGLKDNE